jgi:hypothetical protein
LQRHSNAVAGHSIHSSEVRLMANHASTGTQPYDRCAEEVTLDEVERILV